VNKVSVTFKTILDQYKHQPQYNTKVFRDVVISDSNEKGDIIGFYNQTFIPAMEKFLRQCSEEENINKQSPMKKVTNTSTQNNLYLSPLRSPLTTTPSARSLFYNVGISPVKNLHQINNTLNSPTGIIRSKKRLAFDEPTLESSSLKRKYQDLG